MLKNIFLDLTSQYLPDLREILYEDVKSVHMTAECQKFRILIHDGGQMMQMLQSVGRVGSYRLDHRAVSLHAALVCLHVQCVSCRAQRCPVRVEFRGQPRRLDRRQRVNS